MEKQTEMSVFLFAIKLSCVNEYVKHIGTYSFFSALNRVIRTFNTFLKWSIKLTELKRELSKLLPGPHTK